MEKDMEIHIYVFLKRKRSVACFHYLHKTQLCLPFLWSQCNSLYFKFNTNQTVLLCCLHREQ